MTIDLTPAQEAFIRGAIAAGRLANHPRIGQSRDVDDHVIIYRIVCADVQTLRVVHGRRDLGPLFGR